MGFWSCFIAIILGISAIISPIITTIMNNRHQLNLKKIEIYELSKRQCLEHFIESAISYKETSNLAGPINLHQNINKLYLYFDNIPKDINKLCDKTTGNYEVILNNIVQSLSKQITKK